MDDKAGVARYILGLRFGVIEGKGVKSIYKDRFKPPEPLICSGCGKSYSPDCEGIKEKPNGEVCNFHKAFQRMVNEP